MMYSREKAVCWKAFIPLIAQPPSESCSKLQRGSGVMEKKRAKSMRWLNWVVPPSCSVPYRGNEQHFYFIGNYVPYEIKTFCEDAHAALSERALQE